MNKYIEVDYRIEYINGLSRENIIGAISGLSETGEEEDSLIVEAYLNSQKIKVVKIAMRALNKLNQKKYLVRMIDLLADPRISISKVVRKLLIESSYALYEKEIYQQFCNTGIFHVKYNCAILLGNLSKWNSIRYIIELMDDNDEQISTYGKVMFDGWQNKFNKSFTSPTKSQICDIKDIINEKMHVLTKEKVRFIEFILNKY